MMVVSTNTGGGGGGGKTQASNRSKSGHFVGSRYDGRNRLSKDNREKCSEVFAQCDVDRSGTISSSELLSMFLKLNVRVPIQHQKVVVAAMLDFLGKTDDITFPEFLKLWSAYHDWKRDKENSAPTMPWLPPVKGPYSSELALFLIFDDPSSCRLAQITSIVIIATIALSVATFVMETHPDFRSWESGRPGTGVEVAPDSFGSIETFSIALFSMEYLVRFFLVGFTPPKKIAWYVKLKNFSISPMNLIDLLAIIPFYIELGADDEGKGGSAFGVLRVLRVARVFRIFKLGELWCVCVCGGGCSVVGCGVGSVVVCW
tara:strand:+ start:197 stop:1144 length:948 start_codon:yes stop_codon:yes gene_type:complete